MPPPRRPPRPERTRPAALAPKTAAVFEHKTLTIGSLDPNTGYFLQASLDSKGASVASIELNDPRYRDLRDAKVPLKLVGNDFDQRFLKLLQDRDTAQSDQHAAAQLVKEAESAVQAERDAVAHLTKDIQSGVRPKDASADADMEHHRTLLQNAQGELERDRTALQAADENLHRAERDVNLAQRTFNADVPDIDTAFAPIRRTSPVAIGRWPRSPATRLRRVSIRQ